jgi:hypothetical protein
MNNKIEPCYINFNQAKLLKEKGFDCETEHFYTDIKKPRLSKGIEYMSDAYVRWWKWNSMPDNYPTESKDVLCSAPEQWQVIEWLRINHGIWIYTWYSSINMTYRVWYQNLNIKGKDTNPNEISLNKICNTPQEVYSEVFDYILTNLI